MDILQKSKDFANEDKSQLLQAKSNIEYLWRGATIEGEKERDLQKTLSCLENDLQNDARNKKKACEDGSKFNSDLKEKINVLQAEKVMMEKQIAFHEDELNHLKKEESVLKEAPTVDMLQKTKLLEEEDMMFRKTLALDIIKVKEGLQFIFTQLDDKNPELPYTFILVIDKNRKYSVASSEPAITDVDVLVDQLNSSNDLSQFVLNIRRRFKAMAKFQATACQN